MNPSAPYPQSILIVDNAELKSRQQRLEEALDNVNILRGLIPIGSYCRRIRDDHGFWDRVETCLIKHSAARFSHGICPECVKEHFLDCADEVAAPVSQPAQGSSGA